jgi:ArsR family metal-binding transcriptional regulator
LKHFPDADLTAIKNEIQKLRNAISRAFPNARYGNNRDDFAFKRVKPTITPFKKAITENSKRLKDAQNWSSFVEYLEFAIDEVLSMPHFDAEKNNKARDGLLKHLNTQYEQMLKVKNLGLEKDELEEIKETITRANDRSGSFAGALAACEKRLQ